MERQVFHRALGLSLVGGLSTAIGTVPRLPAPRSLTSHLLAAVGVVRCGS